MKREMVCIICPRGCTITADVQGDTVCVSGNSCPKGADYAKNECICPVRIVTATVRVVNRLDTMVSVKTETPVPKTEMADVMKALRMVTAKAPLLVGDVLLQDVCGSRILITKAVQ